MRFLVIAAVCSSFVLPLAAPVEAQTRRLPRKSASERQVEDINRNLRQEESERQFERQYRIDNNLLRQQVDRQRVLSNPPPVPRIGPCPSGSIRCN
jgi:hypothetical protein